MDFLCLGQAGQIGETDELGRDLVQLIPDLPQFAAIAGGYEYLGQGLNVPANWLVTVIMNYRPTSESITSWSNLGMGTRRELS